MRKKWKPTPVFLPRKFHRQRSLAGYSPWGCKESDTTERLSRQQREQEAARGEPGRGGHLGDPPCLAKAAAQLYDRHWENRPPGSEA